MRRFSLAAVVLSAGLAFTPAAFAAPLTPAFTYQGEIFKAGTAVNGTADLRFTLWDSAAGGVQIGGVVARNNVSVSGGVFTTSLDFGADAFANGEERYLQIELRSPAGAGAFTTLGTRQPITATPYAVTATRGAAPFVVKRSTSSSAVILEPDGFPQVEQRNSAGDSVGGLALNGTGAMYSARNGAGGTTALLGASGDQSGFLEMYTDTGSMAVLLEAESVFGQAGYLRLIGTSTGTNGGVFEATNNGSSTTFRVTGGVVGGSSTVSLYDGGIEALRMFGETAVPGGSIYTYDENGATEWVLEPDFSGDGAFMLFSNPSTFASMSLQSDLGGSPSISAGGTASGFSVRTDIGGDNSVQLATDAVNAVEMFNEPGLAHNRTSAVTLPTGTYGSVLSRTITVPAAGYVLVLFDGDTALTHVNGAVSWVEWIIDDVAGGSGSGNDDMLHLLPSGAASGGYDFATSSHAVFSVPAAGSYTYHVNMLRVGGSAGTLHDGQLTVIYFPTAYGTVNPSFTGDDFRGHTGNGGPTRPALSGAEIAAERANSQAENMIRIQSEMLAMKQEMAELRAMMANDPNMKAARAKDAIKGEKLPANAVESNVVPVADAVDAPVAGR